MTDRFGESIRFGKAVSCGRELGDVAMIGVHRHIDELPNLPSKAPHIYRYVYRLSKIKNLQGSLVMLQVALVTLSQAQASVGSERVVTSRN